MSLDAYVSNRFMENRLYFGPQGGDLKALAKDPLDAYKGASARSYGNFVGFILSKIGYATKVKVGEKEFFVNNKSFCKLMVRHRELRGIGFETEQELHGKVHELYLSHKKTEYDDISLLEAKMKDVAVKEGGIFDVLKVERVFV